MIQYKNAGDRALVVEFENEISKKVNQKVQDMAAAVENCSVRGIEEVVPAYRSLLIFYNPLIISGSHLKQTLIGIAGNIESSVVHRTVVVEIPTLYGGDFGPDLEYVAQYNGLSRETVIKVHSEREYLIYMLGFTPGFPYLGGLAEEIATPRLEVPRTKTPAGSVGIAGSQTGIYPIQSPGGWRIIGKTPLKLFDPNRSQPFLLKAGEYLKFIPIDQKEYEEIEHLVAAGKFEVMRKEIIGADKNDHV